MLARTLASGWVRLQEHLLPEPVPFAIALEQTLHLSGRRLWFFRLRHPSPSLHPVPVVPRYVLQQLHLADWKA